MKEEKDFAVDEWWVFGDVWIKDLIKLYPFEVHWKTEI